MGGDPASSESVSARGVAGVRGGSRGRCRGDLLGNCSYSRTGGRGCDGGGVGVHGGVLRQLITVSRVCCVPSIIGRTNASVLSRLRCIPKFVNRRNGR